jgi:hypothetical protein
MFVSRVIYIATIQLIFPIGTLLKMKYSAIRDNLRLPDINPDDYLGCRIKSTNK